MGHCREIIQNDSMDHVVYCSLVQLCVAGEIFVKIVGLLNAVCVYLAPSSLGGLL